MALSRVKRITGLPVRFGGIEHSGWLPPGAAEPAVTPMEEVIVDLEIVADGSAYLPCWLWATAWFLVCGVGVLVYVFYYASKKDDAIYLRT